MILSLNSVKQDLDWGVDRIEMVRKQALQICAKTSGGSDCTSYVLFRDDMLLAFAAQAQQSIEQLAAIPLTCHPKAAINLQTYRK